MTAKKPPPPANGLRELVDQARAGRNAPQSPREFTDAEAQRQQQQRTPPPPAKPKR